MKKILTTEEAVQFLDGFVSKATLHRWRKSPKPIGPKWVKMGNKVGYLAEDLKRYLDECVQAS